MVSSINKQYLTSNSELDYIGSFTNGKEALDFCEKNQVELAIVDYYMPVMDGLEFIRNCRKKHLQLDFIMITAANQTENISACMHLGAVDYLIKPFTFDRFQTAIKRFIDRKKFLHGSEALSQEEIDKMFSPSQTEDTSSTGGLLEKGLQKKTLDLVQFYFATHPNTYLTNEEIAKAIGLSRITVRRYVNYMMDCGQLASEINYGTGGRPSIRYKYKR